MRTFFAFVQPAELTRVQGGEMKEISRIKRDRLAQEMGWTLERAQGYVDGEASQQCGLELSPFHRVAMDEYSKGLRTGYYTQACSLSIWTIRDCLAAR
jgi:hypothetical protein